MERLQVVNKKIKMKRAQATLELVFAMLGTLILLYGTFGIFMWVNNRLINRQESYDSPNGPYGRVKGSKIKTSYHPKVVIVDETDKDEFPDADVFGQFGDEKN